VLGLFLGGGRLTFALVRSGDAAPVVAKQGSEPFALAPGQDEPEVIAAKLREILTQHRIKVKHCVLALPLGWIVSSRIETGGLSGEALAGAASLELERLCGAAVAPDQLVCLPADSSGQALALAMEPSVARHLGEAFRLAGLKLGWFLPAVAGGQTSGDEGLVVDMLPLAEEVDAVVRRDGMPVALRQLALFRDSGSRRMEQCLQTTMRSLQVTISALGSDPESEVQMRLLGTGHCVTALHDGLQERSGWSPMVVPCEDRLPEQEAAVMAGSLDWAKPGELALAPPPRKRKDHWWRGTGARPIVAAAALVALLVLTFVVAGVVRHMAVRGLEDKLAEYAPDRQRGEALRDALRLTAPWYSQTPEQLLVLKTVAESFPEQGTVWVTDLSVENDGKATLSGCARSQSGWLKVQDELQKRTLGLRVVRTREGVKAGEPMTFLVTFSMSPNGARKGA
jgi:hypothetical protein